MKFKYIIAFILSVVMIISCKPLHKHDVLILYPNWAEGIAITYLAKTILEDKGYQVLIKRIEPGPIYASLYRGDADVYMDAWLPNTHRSYWERFQSKLEILGTAFSDGFTGLVVPAYVDINSIEELNQNRDKFDGKIYGIAPGSGIYDSTEKAIKQYNLDFDQVGSSETSMIAVLKKAIAEKKWIVVTAWKPHFIWEKYDLKPLQDPKKVYPIDQIKIVSRKYFSEDKPELAAFFKNFHLTEKQLNELMQDVSAKEDPSIGTEAFYQKYKSEFSQWVIQKQKIIN